MSAAPIIDECYRCGYDLRGIADDRPCPECGLLAQRNRRESDELHHTRPQWLSSLSRGVWIILFGLFCGIAWQFIAGAYANSVFQWLSNSRLTQGMMQPLIVGYSLFGVGVIAFALPIGGWLLTRPEGYLPSDQRDRKRRQLLRITSFAPLAGIFIFFAAMCSVQWYWMSRTTFSYGDDAPRWVLVVQRLSDYLPGINILGCIPLPLLLFYQLRSLAKRARSAHLAEHCAIVGIGTAGAFAYALLLYLLDLFHSELHLPPNWYSRGTPSLLLNVILITAGILFLLWSLYLLIRFAIAFGGAARKLRKTWARDDRSMVNP